MFKRIIVITISFLIFSSLSFSQTEKVRTCLKKIASGKIQEVKMEMVDLLAEYPDDPGVHLLHGIVLDDAYKAVDIYEKLIKKYPDSEWADQAYWRLVQFYAILGNVDRATEELESYRKKFPTSEFLITASDAVRYAKLAAKSDSKPMKNSKVQNVSDEDKEVVPVKKNVEKEQKKTKEIKEKPQKELKNVENDDSEDVKSNWGLQVGVYSTQEVAQQEMEKFTQMRLRTVVIDKKVDGAKMYAVVIGNYSTKESAEQAKAIVQNQCGCSPIIVKK